MDKLNSKIMTVSFAATGAILGLTLSLLIQAFTGVFPVMARLGGQDWFRHGVPVGVAFATFLLLQLNPKVRVWADEVISEIRKVVWPSRKDTTAMTIVVCIMVLISSAIVTSFDFVSGYVINALMR